MAWPCLEMSLATLLSAIMRADNDAALAVFLVMRRATGRYESVSEAANAVLDAAGKEYVHAALKVVSVAETERNAMAHAAWGYSDIIDDGILWLSEKDATHFHVSTSRMLIDEADINSHEISEKVFVYKRQDIFEIEKQILAALSVVNKLVEYIDCYFSAPLHCRLQHLSVELENLAPMKEVLRQMRTPSFGKTP